MSSEVMVTTLLQVLGLSFSLLLVASSAFLMGIGDENSTNAVALLIMLVSVILALIFFVVIAWNRDYFLLEFICFVVLGVVLLISSAVLGDSLSEKSLEDAAD